MAVAFIAGCGDDDDANGDDALETYTVVGIFPLTGALGTFGENSSEVARLAARDVNTWLEEEGKNWRLRLEIDDTATEGSVGLRKMQTWYGEGVQFFAGPQASGVAMECLSFANANQILYISPSSTSPALAIPDDFLLRFCTTDALQGPAIAKIVKESGAKHVIFSWRGDTWGDGLQAATAEALSGVTVYPRELRYDPLKEDFSTDIALLDDYVSDLVGQGAALNEIALVVIAFEEIAPFIAQATEYDQLKEIVWIGSDGTANSEALVSHPTASKFADDVRFVNTINRPPAETPQSRFQYVRDHIQTEFGRETDAYSYNTYDIIWAFALSIDEVGYDSVKVKEILPRVADKHTAIHGASGHVVLNADGDRAFADFDLWLISNGQWQNVGYYDGATGQINWDRKIY